MTDPDTSGTLGAPPQPLSRLVQIAYVTNDLDRAREIFRTDYGIEKWLNLGEAAGRRTISIEVLDGTIIEIRGAVAYVGAVQFELIQPVVDAKRLYLDLLPVDGTFAIRFHHLGFNRESKEAVRELRRMLSDSHGVPLETRSETMPVFYADSRDRLGHYLEYFSLPMEFDALIPRN